MNHHAIIAAALLLGAGGPARGDVEIRGSARSVRANGNEKANIVSELRTLDLCGMVGTGKTLAIREVKLQLEIGENEFIEGAMPRQTDSILFQCRLAMDGDSLENRTWFMYEYYIVLRLNGLSSLGAVRILKQWFGPGDTRVGDRIGHMPVEECERLEKFPEWYVKMGNPEFFANLGGERFYLFRDGDLVWILRENKDHKTCGFEDGLDGKHFNSTAFGAVFAEEYRRAGGGLLTPKLAEKLRKRFREAWGLEWYSLEVPLPGSRDPGK